MIYKTIENIFFSDNRDYNSYNSIKLNKIDTVVCLNSFELKRPIFYDYHNIEFISLSGNFIDKCRELISIIDNNDNKIILIDGNECIDAIIYILCKKNNYTYDMACRDLRIIKWGVFPDCFKKKEIVNEFGEFDKFSDLKSMTKEEIEYEIQINDEYNDYDAEVENCSIVV